MIQSASPQPPKRTLGDTIRRHRERAGLSIRQLSAKTQLHHSYIARLEIGVYEKPTLEVLQSIAVALGIEPRKLLRYIGIKSADTMPTPRVYFRRAYHLTPEQAKAAETQVNELIAGLRQQGDIKKKGETP